MIDLRIADIRTDGGTQSRVQLDWIAVSEYAAAMKDGARFPPVVVFHDGAEYWLADGFHRVRAAENAGLDTVAADVRQGTRRDAVLYSVGANSDHGVRRTNADKRAAVLLLLGDDEWREWPDSKVAAACGVSREYVVRLRAETSCDRSQDKPKIVQRSGRTYAMNTAAIGRGNGNGTDSKPELLTGFRPDYVPPTEEELAEARASYNRAFGFRSDPLVPLSQSDNPDYTPTPNPPDFRWQQECPLCGDWARVDEGGAGRFWWFCSTCRYETDMVSADLLTACWDETNAGMRERHWEGDATAGAPAEEDGPEPNGCHNCIHLDSMKSWGEHTQICNLRLIQLGDWYNGEDCEDWSAAPADPPAPVPVAERLPVAIYNADAQQIHALGLAPVHLVVTSPPYNVGIDYDMHADNLSTYFDLLQSVWRQCFDVLEDGGRMAVVVPFGVGRNPWIPMAAKVMDTLTTVGFTLRGQIIWDKNTSGNRTSWGSFRMATDPSLRDTTEAVIVAHKGASKLDVPAEHKGHDEKGTFTPFLADSDYFMELAQDHWIVAPESAQRVKHPAPFPVELVRRLIHFYAFPGAHILDPFAGSGTTGIAARECGCRASLVELSAEYCKIAEARCKQ